MRSHPHARSVISIAMDRRQQRELTTIVSARTFLRQHGLADGRFAVVIKNLDDVIARVGKLTVTTSVTRNRQLAKAIRACSNDLRRIHMIPISRRGKTLFRGEVAIENALRVPPARATPETIAAAADEMIQQIAPHKKLFVAQGFARSFLSDMRASSKRLNEMVAYVQAQRTSSPDDFVELRRQVARGRREIGVGDALMTAWLQTDPPNKQILAAAWRTAHRITARLGRPRKRSSSSNGSVNPP